MDLSRFGSKTHESVLRDALRAKYADKKIDVVVAFYPGALDFLLAHGSEIFPGAPIVFCGIDRRQLGDRSLPPHVHGVLMKREFAPTVEIALRIHPDTKQITVVAGTSEFDAGLLDQARQEFRAYEDRLAFTYLTNLPLEKLLAELRQLPPHTIVLYTNIFKDGAGVSFIPHNVLPLVSTAANAPVYGFLDEFLGRGIVGGNLYSSSAHGVEAAKLVLLVLADPQSQGSHPVEISSDKMLFDWRQLQKWHISESILPAASEIRFRPPGMWEQFPTQVLAAFAVFLSQIVLIGWLVYEHRRRHLAELQARDSMAELTPLNRLATAGELSAAIAHEIRQPIGAMVTMAGAAIRWLSKENPEIGEAREALTDVVATGHRAGDIVTNVRRLFGKDTHEDAPRDMNTLVRRVLALVYIDIRKWSIEAQLNLTEQLPSIHGNEIQLQQVILNLVMNAIDAMVAVAEPRILSITSKLNDDHSTVVVLVADTGSGIDMANLSRIFKPMFTTKARGMGMGLSICKSIIVEHNGWIWATVNIPRGTIFYFELPFRRGGQHKSELDGDTFATGDSASTSSSAEKVN
jgi:signal transduction histidine kinase